MKNLLVFKDEAPPEGTLVNSYDFHDFFSFFFRLER